MQKNWLRVFLLCVACAVCLHGNCSAERWVKYGDVPGYGGPSPMYVDTDSVQSLEYNGRKFLKATTKVVYTIDSSVSIANTVFDLENNRSLTINSVHGSTRSQADISLITSADVVISVEKNEPLVYNPANGMYVSLQPDSNLLQAIKQYRPDVVNEILAFNAGGTTSQEAPSGGTLTGGNLIIPPTTLPVDDSSEVYDLTQTSIRYESWSGYSFHDQVFVLSYEAPTEAQLSLRSDLPDMWYKITYEKPEKDIEAESWNAFTYDSSTNTFTWYHDWWIYNDTTQTRRKIIIKDYYKVLDANRLLYEGEYRVSDETQSAHIGERGETHVMIRDSERDFWTEGPGFGINRYKTDGMFIFLNYVIKE